MPGQAADYSFGSSGMPLARPRIKCTAVCMHGMKAAKRPLQYPLLVSVLVLIAASLSYWCMLCSLPRSPSIITSAYSRRPSTRSMAYKGYAFEVTGKVQGVFFRQSTVEQAQKLGLVGWVRNAPSGTVQGEAQGPSDKADSLKDWLQHTGSPSSRIDKCDFSNERTLSNLDFDTFEQRS